MECPARRALIVFLLPLVLPAVRDRSLSPASLFQAPGDGSNAWDVEWVGSGLSCPLGWAPDPLPPVASRRASNSFDFRVAPRSAENGGEASQALHFRGEKFFAAASPAVLPVLLERPTACISASTMMRTSSRRSTLGFHPSSFRAFLTSARRTSTSAGR